ncbi:hypothetical protein PHMEG_0005562 [Phytophthora megakarya]|uniref:Uncharacterized protein n=1 Tax=Phytophthora megakarya TaxID=4795 RepID=A0A225WSN8_9STRA|nr:hypothetical protein PHMEG_0005562 [Phytophthora megakarya]
MGCCCVKVVNISQSRLWYEQKLTELEDSLRPPCRHVPVATTARVACLQNKYENILYASHNRVRIEHEAEPESEGSPDPAEKSGRINPIDRGISPDSWGRAHERTSVQTLETAYIRVVKATQEELDIQPDVYIHEGSEMMSQLRDDLMMLPDLGDLTSECDVF